MHTHTHTHKDTNNCVEVCMNLYRVYMCTTGKHRLMCGCTRCDTREVTPTVPVWSITCWQKVQESDNIEVSNTGERTTQNITHACTHTHTHKYTHTCLQICVHAHTHTSQTPHTEDFFFFYNFHCEMETVTSSEQMGTSEHSGIPSYWQQEKVRAISFNVTLTGRLSWNWGAFLKPFSNKKGDNIFIAKDEVSFREMGCEEWIYRRNDSKHPKFGMNCLTLSNLSFLKSNLRTYVL